MVRVGCHVSIAGSIDKAVDRAAKAGCDTFQIFTRNPRGWKSKPLDESAASTFREKVRDTGISPPVAHMPYLPNLATPKSELYEKSLATYISELERCEMLGIPYLVTHLGSHLGTGREGGIERIISGINNALQDDNSGVMVLLENTAGTKNSIGGAFEDIREIIDGITKKERIGICFDTCHAFAAGYDLRTGEAVQDTFTAFDSTIGLEHLKVLHMNDSKGELGSRLDRHEHIGLGQIGEEGMSRILRHPALRELPFICETPDNDTRNDIGNIKKVRELAEE